MRAETFILDKERALKPSRVLRKTREYILSVYKEIKLKIPHYSLTKYKKLEILEKEKWKKTYKRNRHFAYYKMVGLQAQIDKKIDGKN